VVELLVESNTTVLAESKMGEVLAEHRKCSGMERVGQLEVDSLAQVEVEEEGKG